MNSQRMSDLGRGFRMSTDLSSRVDRQMLNTINNALARSLGSDYALALRVCLNTSLALSDPDEYTVALKEILGHARASDVIAGIEGRFREEARSRPATRRMRFTELVHHLRLVPLKDGIGSGLVGVDS